MDKPIEEMTRQELLKAASDMANEQGLTVPFGTDNKTLRAMLKGEQPFIESAKRRKMKNRRPLGGFRSKLSVEGLDIPNNKKARWVNDKPGRLLAAQEGGYEFVEDENAKVGEEPLNGRDNMNAKISRVVGTAPDGTPLRAFLMVIDKELFDEDQREKQKRVDEVDNAIKRGSIEGEPGQDGKYVPKGGIRIESNM